MEDDTLNEIFRSIGLVVCLLLTGGLIPLAILHGLGYLLGAVFGLE